MLPDPLRRRRAELEREQATARAKADVLKPLLGMADNFERARQSIKPQTPGEAAVHDAYQALAGQLEAFLKWVMRMRACVCAVHAGRVGMWAVHRWWVWVGARCREHCDFVVDVNWVR